MVKIRISVADATGAERLLRRLAADGLGSVEVSTGDRSLRDGPRGWGDNSVRVSCEAHACLYPTKEST